MSAPAQRPPHPSDDEFVLHYYGELDEAARQGMEAHLAACPACRTAFRSLDDVLALVSTHAEEEAPEGFERVMWARIRPVIERGSSPGWRGWLSATRLAFAGSVAALVIAAFVAGRWSSPAPAPADPAPAVASVEPGRVWLVAVGDHLDRSQMVLAEVLNADPAAPVPAIERERAADLVAGSRLIRQSDATGREPAVADVLEELERVLIEIANGGDDWTAADFEALRSRIEERGVLFRLRVVGSEVRERGVRRAPQS